mgnify:CR=1 FL=1
MTFQNPWQEVKDSLDITEVIAEYARVKPAGANYKILCPFHRDKNPSLIISPSKQIWHCFGCGAGGDVFGFVSQYNNISKKEALEMLAKKAGIEIKPTLKPSQGLNNQKTNKEDTRSDKKTISRFEKGSKYLEFVTGIYHKLLLKILKDRSHPVSQYLIKRGLDLDIIKTFQIGYAPRGGVMITLANQNKLDLELLFEIAVLKKTESGEYRDKFSDRLTFPIKDPNSKVVGFTSRVLDYDQTDRPKYLNTAATNWFNKSKIWYGFDLMRVNIRQENKAILVEGNMDVIASYAAGIQYTLASQGTSFTTDQLKILGYTTKNIELAFDNDNAGKLSAKKLFKQASEMGFKVNQVIIPSEFKDLDEYLKSSTFKAENRLKSMPFLEYILSQNLVGLTSKELGMQKQAVVDFLDLLTGLDRLDQEFYNKK